ncbi:MULTISPECIES: RdgB/HAM1 family non-canonical purine NTP pyrophosphatase [Caldimonas]|jgi:XTP/dITP diphosphohydrolase|uniref:RdgB/HAM1 family non-canonical purine NTP pyrophosphatase n=1 Tax=Caldimonas TaxID=196013 RepID=UPI000364BEC4|nr:MULTISPECIES: RdgB/HAM1 family non-canonical purine NTP pyrophosphatase [Caldimonas]MCX7659611.1 RdgB/HAM1 family non-canonical purine NTP pyrophosphatase [Caldimonas manganoxidans]GIX25681.1 MAG: non-canonical purine NTP pyrophosphatase [Caldimonas sp.]
MRVVLASNNAKKLRELEALLDGLGLQLVPQGDLGIAEAEEPHDTFIENALAKARHAARASAGPAVADDSGLCVDALGGEPGVHSAVYAPVPVLEGEREVRRAAQDAANNEKLLQRLQGVSQRRARFVSVLVALRHASDPEPLVAMGRWEGEILQAPRGQGGFGYDPLVYIPALGRSVAELDAATKNAHSHRALAARRLRELMREVWGRG